MSLLALPEFVIGLISVALPALTYAAARKAAIGSKGSAGQDLGIAELDSIQLRFKRDIEVRIIEAERVAVHIDEQARMIAVQQQVLHDIAERIERAAEEVADAHRASSLSARGRLKAG